MTLLTELKHKQILVLGAGITGLSCARYLNTHQLCFAVNDSRTKPFADDYSEQKFDDDFPNARLYLGQWQSDLIATADIILISPGIDSSIKEIAPYISEDCLVMGDVELFCLLNNELAKPIKLLALTGSNGKSTVVSMLAYLAECLKVKAQLGGNIGQPVLDIFTEASFESERQTHDLPDFVILELSSFQLETLTSMEAIATSVLNISDDHLDRHQTMENYIQVKHAIYPQGKLAIINRDDKSTFTANETQPVISFGSDIPTENNFGIILHNEKSHLAFGKQPLIAIDKLPLAGMHNALNYLAALAFGHSAGWSTTAMVDNLAGFTGLAHRCQRVDSQDNIVWINDSKATNIGATIAAINGLAQTLAAQGKNKQRLILIAGGDGKGADFSQLKEPLDKHVHQLITLGKDGSQIAELLANSNNVTSLDEAVIVAKANANAGDIVLLSPACASIDMFKNFSERGEHFVSAVNRLTEAS